ncbi:MAG: hypothetical protein HN737_06395 [Desulfobacterales bacterium]|jgi:hypothetical protein|nr:hypothetical protein [Desulfobacterales bacterium]
MKRTADRLRIIAVDNREEMLKLYSQSLDQSVSRLMAEVNFDLTLCRNVKEVVK